MLLLLFVAQLVHVARVTSANWDECHHVYDGYNILTHRDYRLNAEVPPLVKMTAALPLLLMKIGPLPAQDKSQALNAFIGGREFVFGNGGDRVLLPARLMCCLFALALASLVYAVARRVFGEWAGLAALLLFVFDPLVLAHGSLVSTDAASALFLFGSVAAWWRYAQRQTPARFAVAGLVVGLAFSAKFTGILAVPMLVLLAVMEGLRQRRWSVLGSADGCCHGRAADWMGGGMEHVWIPVQGGSGGAGDFADNRTIPGGDAEPEGWGEACIGRKVPLAAGRVYLGAGKYEIHGAGVHQLLYG